MAFFNSKAPCPYCYAPIEISKVAFRCREGGHMAGKLPCKPTPDEARKTHFNDDAAYMPVICAKGSMVLAKSSATCSDCGGTSTLRICPRCHVPLPGDFNSESLLVGLVGVRRSGKTVMLSVLQSELESSVARRFDVWVKPFGAKSGLAKELSDNRRRMTGVNEALPEQTSEGRRKEPAVFQWGEGDSTRTRRTTLFSFYDNAGEDFATVDKALSLEYLSATSGIVLLLDPFGFPGNHERARAKGITVEATSPEDVLDSLTYVLRTSRGLKQRRKISQPIAVVISKIDAFFDQIPGGHPLRQPSSQRRAFSSSECQTVHDHVGALIESWGGDGLIRMLESNYATYRLFGASALGAEPDYVAGRVNSRGVLPHRVSEPLLWILSHYKIVPTEA